MPITDFLASIGQAAGSAGLGMLDRRDSAAVQDEYNAKALARSVAAQKDIGKFNQGLALDTWDKTNYKAQVDQMKKAGLSVGLMYGGSGGGGATTNGGSAGGAQQSGVSAGGMGMDLSTIAQLGLVKAQKENVEADTKLKEVEANKRSGVDTDEARNRIQKLAAETSNSELQNSLLSLDKELKQVEVNVAKGSEEARKEAPEIVNKQIIAATNKAKEETKSAHAKGTVDEATVDTTIKQIKQNAVEQSLRIQLQKIAGWQGSANIRETEGKIEKISEEIIRMQEQTKQGAQGLNLEQQKILLERIKTEFNTGDEANVIRWIQSMNGIVGALK